MNTQNHTTFSEMVVAAPLILRLNWWRAREKNKSNVEGEQGLFLQSINMLWTEMLVGEERKEEYKNSAKLSRYGEDIKRGLEKYTAGEDVDWPEVCADIPLLWQNLPPFRKRVLQTLYEHVGHGQTVTYGQLATLAGSPKAARAVGSAMSANPWALIVP